MTSRARALDQIAAAIRRDVLSGVLGPGQPLREESLAERFGASRHTVRSALAALVAERLLTASAYRGVRVSEFDDEQLADLQQLRTALESEAVRLVAEDGRDLAPVHAAIDALAAAERAGGDGVESAHAAVHQALVDAAGSRRISESYRALEGELTLLLLHTRPVYRHRDLAGQHRELLAALPREGVGAIREHIAASTRELLSLRAARARR